MEPARSIARLGFRKWYERRLLEAHAWLAAAVLCAICVGLLLEDMSLRQHALVWLGKAGGAFVGGLIVWSALRRFFAIVAHAERLSRQSICAGCRTYARFEIVSPQPRMGVRCRQCGHEWTISSSA